MVESGACEVVMALGFEKMAAGSLTAKFEDRTNPLDKTIEVLGETAGIGAGPFAAQIFGSGAAEYIDKYAATWDHVGKIGTLVPFLTRLMLRLNVHAGQPLRTTSILRPILTASFKPT
jgi:hypothetical protein